VARAISAQFDATLWRARTSLLMNPERTCGDGTLDPAARSNRFEGQYYVAGWSRSSRFSARSRRI
jgi:hypothetical protein